MRWSGARTARRAAAAAVLVLAAVNGAAALAAEPSTSSGTVPSSTVSSSSPLATASADGRVTVGRVTVVPSVHLVDGQLVTIDVASVGRDELPVPVLCVSGGTLTAALKGRCGFPGVIASRDLSAEALRINATFAQDLGTGPRTDCRSASCELVVFDFATAALKVIARVPLSFTPGAPLRPTPVLTVAPAAMLVDGQQVTASLSGAVGNGGTLAECSHAPASFTDLKASCLPIANAQIGPGGTSASSFPVAAFLNLPSGLVDCRAATATCAIALYRPAGAAIPVASLQFDPAGSIAPRIVLHETAPVGDILSADLIGFTPAATATLRLCNAAGACLTKPTASKVVGADGVAHDLNLAFGNLDFTEASTVCGGAAGCFLDASDTAGKHAKDQDFWFSVGSGGGPFHSARLPVTVTPDSGLHDGQQVAVTATGLAKGAAVETLICDGRFLTDGFGACDFGGTTLRQLRRRISAAGSAWHVRGRGLDASGRYTGTIDVVQTIVQDDSGASFDCRNGNVDPVAFAKLSAQAQADVLKPGSGYRTCVVVVDDSNRDAQSGLAPIAFAGAVFKELPGAATTPDAPTRPAPPAIPIGGTPRYTG
ncbi:MAG: hypothetical protein JWN46_1547 [Acidimicrobiales bacterium]|nr:hypothetical protein [Acidimicrobiales bacterium]